MATPLIQTKRLRLAIGLLLAAFCATLWGGSPGGGIGGTGITGFGQIQAFGSVFVNGREYFLSASTHITVDGRTATREALHIGDVVIVRGRADPASRTGQARQIQVEHALVGRVENVTGAGSQFTVLGQTVRLAPTARFAAPGTASVALRRGDVVAVSALSMGGGAWLATRVTRLHPAQGTPAAERFILRGTVTGIDRARGVIRIGNQPVSVKAGALGAIRAGERVRVEGRYRGTTLDGTRLSASQVLSGSRGAYVEMEGFASPVPGGAGRLTSNGVVIRYREASPSSLARIRESSDQPLVFAGRVQPDGSLEVVHIELPSTPRTGPTPSGPEHQGGGHDRPGVERSGAGEGERPEISGPHVERPEVAHPEIEHPEIERPEFQRPELPDLERPDR